MAEWTILHLRQTNRDNMYAFKNYMKTNHKYGVKFFKPCLLHRYTFKFEIYYGKEHDWSKDISSSKEVLMELCDEILD